MDKNIKTVAGRTKGVAHKIVRQLSILAPLIMIAPAFSYAQSMKNTAYGGIESTIVSKSNDRTIYRAQSNQFPSHIFSKEDLDDYAYRLNRRNCSDIDILTIMKSGHVFQYDFYGSDKAKVGSFYTTYDICKSLLGNSNGPKSVQKIDSAFDQAINELEAKYPALNPNDGRFNQRLVDQVLARMTALNSQGVTKADALRRAAREVMTATYDGSARYNAELQSTDPADHPCVRKELQKNPCVVSGSMDCANRRIRIITKCLNQ